MKFTATVVSPDGDTSNFHYAECPDLGMLKDWVGGYIEVVPAFSTYGTRQCVVFCNEEGKLEGMLPNIKATLLWAACIAPFRLQDILHGDVVIITAENPDDLGEL